MTNAIDSMWRAECATCDAVCYTFETDEYNVTDLGWDIAEDGTMTCPDCLYL